MSSAGGGDAEEGSSSSGGRRVTRSGAQAPEPRRQQQQQQQWDSGVRGETRSEAPFRRTSRGNYASLAALKKAHQRIFSLEPLFVLGGECCVGVAVAQ
jgi:hypothetical protein